MKRLVLGLGLLIVAPLALANDENSDQPAPVSNYESLGLKNGDVIRGINGEDVNSPERALQLMGETKTSPQLELKSEDQNSETPAPETQNENGR